MSNVEKGDTAMMTDADNYGRLVHVEHRDVEWSLMAGELIWWCVSLQTVQCADSPLVDGPRAWPPGTPVLARDRHLRPIRDTDGADEVNAIAQRKSGREVKA